MAGLLSSSPTAALRPPTEQRFTSSGYNIVLRSIDADNISDLMLLNQTVLPVVYQNKFYSDILQLHPSELSCLAYINGQIVAGITCRRELSSDTGSGALYRIYIMTLCVLAPYRRLNIGSLLLQTIIQNCQSDASVSHMCLHVQTNNEQALRFYERNGFRIFSRIEGYYSNNKGVEPPHAFFLLRHLRHSTA
eukprot:jgi/Hompol1/1359/HPOL_004764-RA